MKKICVITEVLDISNVLFKSYATFNFVFVNFVLYYNHEFDFYKLFDNRYLCVFYNLLPTTFGG